MKGQREGEEHMCLPVMVIFASEDIDMECHTRRHRERVEDVRDHLCREIANFFSLELQVSNAVRASGYVNHSS